MKVIVINVPKILWLSRHDMTDSQLAALKDVFPNASVTKVDRTIQDTEQLIDCCKGFDILAAVLPVEILLEFMMKKPDGLRVVFSKSGRIKTDQMRLNPSTGLMENEYRFDFIEWKEIVWAKGVITKLK